MKKSKPTQLDLLEQDGKATADAAKAEARLIARRQRENKWRREKIDSDPEWAAKISRNAKIRANRWHEKNKGTPKFKAQQKAQAEKKRASLAADPEKLQKKRDGERAWAKKNPEKMKAKAHRAYMNNRALRLAEAKIYRTVNKEKVNASIARWNEANPGKKYQAIRNWKKNNPEKNALLMAAGGARHRSKKLSATPKWSEANKIDALYRECVLLNRNGGVRMAVDHIVPLNNPVVCGLHIISNLRIITASENSKKKNKLIPDMSIAPTNANGLLRLDEAA